MQKFPASLLAPLMLAFAAACERTMPVNQIVGRPERLRDTVVVAVCTLSADGFHVPASSGLVIRSCSDRTGTVSTLVSDTLHVNTPLRLHVRLHDGPLSLIAAHPPLLDVVDQQASQNSIHSR